MPLKLTRKTGETIVLDGPGTVEITAIHRSWVTVTVTAPESTLILRGELKTAPVEPLPPIDKRNDPNRDEGGGG